MNKKTIKSKPALLLFILFALVGCKTDLYSGLGEQDANNMLAIMLNQGISAEKIIDKKTNTYTLSVDKSNIPSAVRLLQEHGYPKEKVFSVNEMFQKDGLISSPTEERARFIFALSQSVQETLTQIDGVLVARVHVVLPENSASGQQLKPSSASVFIKYHPAYDLESMKSEIKLIVEKSIEGLSYDKVSVVMVPAQLNKIEK
ncbi:type III secretion system inner membrane ring lipoprotein SctJ [uncultured Thiothrix sp.]|jgi:type III secretion protein J|uniref:type III secretion system inner membrane ring lipoprotein SctJ n=1 Tax=uncultured Thiothrix sp. TaxID=223185 RepID=UPI00262388FA|nr:type III secretion inner membrane ring lipoprotein SctJ [uncultured Thiothrix sp.]HMT92198.1 type III secretion inner membrane ring lipoprotein SctJ [Thiolinea sp.]